LKALIKLSHPKDGSNSGERSMSKESKHVVKFRGSHLNEKEKIIAWGEGYIGEVMGSGDKKQYNGVLVVTDKRVAFYRKGILGEVLETIPIEKITSIERMSMLGHRTIRMHTSNDELEFKTFSKDKELELVNSIETKRATISNPTPAPDPMDALKKLGELRALEVITENEFQEKKRTLLAKL